ncbi:MAG: hypothetical protein JW712_14770 [Dehalococcoidales bacterium]|nr:hypothetical protein [Dehalococcoidales bacterium]
MTRELINILRGLPLVKKTIQRFLDMLVTDEYLYNEVWRIISTEEEVDHIPQYFYDKDIEVNNAEKDIREMILKHLSFHPNHDISGSLVLISLVKDAERIGDYTKNIFEAGILYHGSIKNMVFFDRLLPVQKRISGSFPVLHEAFKNSDKKKASEILRNYASVKRECDKILYAVFSQELSSNEAIVTAMMSRYLKRINSHISNIASGILYPLSEIDFVTGDILE